MDSKVVKRVYIEEYSHVIDYRKMMVHLYKHKKYYIIILPIVFLFAAIYSLSLPNFYNCKVKLSPELSNAFGSSSLANLASTLGMSLGGAMGDGSEALFPMLYPELMKSVDFKTSLFPIKVRRESDGKEFAYYDYLENEQVKPWWKLLAGDIVNWITNENPKEYSPNKDVDPFRLDRKQTLLLREMDRNISCTIDKKSMVITISINDQDASIAACLADSVKNRLQEFITRYRTSKARVDYEYNKKICVEAKERYDKARNAYAEFSDANRGVVFEKTRQKITDLENEMQIQYNIYQQVATRLQDAEMKVQEETPAFTTLQSSTVPVFKAGPKRSYICLTWLLLAFLAITAWILYKEGDLRSLLGFADDKSV